MSTIKQLRGLDGTMVMGDLPGTPLHISALMLYDPPAPGANALNFDRLHEQFQHMVRDQLPMLRCKVNEVPLQLDMPYWVVDENFELYCHLQHIALPAPGGEDELHHLLNMLHSQALRHDRPLWEAWYIEGINNVPGVAHGGVGLFFKVHHALMDGKTAMRLIDGLHAATADAPLAPQLTLNGQPQAVTAPDTYTLWKRIFSHNIEKPFGLARVAARHVPALWNAYRQTPPKNSKPTIEKPHTRFNNSVTQGRVVGHVTFSEKVMQRILQRMPDVSFNEIILCVVGGALHSYLRKHGELPSTSLVCGVPVSTRSRHDVKESGNKVTFANVPLHTDMTNPLQRLLAVHEDSVTAKHIARRIGSGLANDLLDNISSALLIWGGKLMIDTGLLDRLPPVCNTIVSALPGPDEPRYLGGARMRDFYGMGPLAPNVGLFHVVSSLDDKITLTFVACAAQMHDAKRYQLELHASWRELCHALHLRLPRSH